MPMERSEIREFIQNTLAQDNLGQLKGAVIERTWVDDRGNVSFEPGTETQIQVADQHLIQFRRVAPGERVPLGWSILHPVPDALAPDGDLKACPVNAPYSNHFVDSAGQPFEPDHAGTFMADLSQDGTDLVIGTEITSA